MKKYYAMFFGLCLITVANAGTIVAFDSNGDGDISQELKANGYPVSTDNAWSEFWSKDNAVEYASLAISSNLSIPGSPATKQFSAVGWNVSGQYFSMTVDLADGYAFGDDVSLIYGGLRSSGTGPNTGKTTLIINGAESEVRNYSWTAGSSTYLNYIDNIASLISGANSAEIRWYASGASGASGTYRIGDYYSGGVYTDTGLYGSVVQVPEPATIALLASGAMALYRRRK